MKSKDPRARVGRISIPRGFGSDRAVKTHQTHSITNVYRSKWLGSSQDFGKKDPGALERVSGFAVFLPRPKIWI